MQQPQEQRAVEESCPVAQPPARGHQRQHQQADADHDAKAKKGNGDGRTVLRLEILQAFDLAVQTMGQDEAAEKRHIDGEAIGFVGGVWNGKQGAAERVVRCPIAPRWRRAWPADVRAC